MLSLICSLNLAIPIPSLASSGIFLSISSAKKIATDVKYCKVTEEKLTICNDTTKNQFDLIQTKSEYITGLEKDKFVVEQNLETYKNLYINTNDKLIKSEGDKPSRLTWFGTGVVSTLVLVLLGIFATK